jgi:hypothetical protein
MEDIDEFDPYADEELDIGECPSWITPPLFTLDKNTGTMKVDNIQTSSSVEQPKNGRDANTSNWMSPANLTLNKHFLDDSENGNSILRKKIHFAPIKSVETEDEKVS